MEFPNAFLIPLKLKHRNPNSRMNKRAGVDPSFGTLTFSGGRFKAITSNAGQKSKGITSGQGPRKRAYGPW